MELLQDIQIEKDLMVRLVAHNIKNEKGEKVELKWEVGEEKKDEEEEEEEMQQVRWGISSQRKFLPLSKCH